MGGGLPAAKEYARQVDVDDGLPLLQAQFVDDLSLPGLHQQAVAENARVVDQRVQPTEVPDHLLEQSFDIRFLADIGRVATDFGAQRLARLPRLVQARFFEIHQYR